VIVHNLNVVRVPFLPAKANAPLVIYPDALLPKPVASQRLKPIAWRDGHLPQFRGSVEHEELPTGCPLDCGRQAPGADCPEDLLCLRASEAQNHWRNNNVIR
jgi:hypothetical protein